MDDLLRLYRETPRPDDLSTWAIDQPALLEAAMAANVATAENPNDSPRDNLPEPAKTLMNDDQLMFVLNAIEQARGSGKVWIENDILEVI